MIKKSKTANGIDLYTFKNENINSFAITFCLRYGSMYESEAHNGISHFFEHIVFKNINLIMEEKLYLQLDLNGLYFNATTTTNYIEFVISGSQKVFCEAADIICKILCPIQLSRNDVKSVANRIKAEIRETDYNNSIDYFCDGIVYKGSPLRKTISGSCSNVSKITLSALKEERKKILSHQNIGVFVSGLFTKENIDFLTSTIESYSVFSAETRSNTTIKPIDFLNREKNVYIKNNATTSVKFSFDVDLKKYSFIELFYLSDLIFCGETAPVYQELSEKNGFSYSYDEACEVYGDMATLSLTYEVKRDKLLKCIEETLDIFARAKESITNRMKYVQAHYSINSNQLVDDAKEFNECFSYVNFILGQSFMSVKERSDAYLAVTPQRINALANEVFTKSNLILAIKTNIKSVSEAEITKIINQKLP